MRTIVRGVGAIVAGVVAGSAVIAVVEALSARIYPLPAGLGLSSADALKAHVATLPMGAFVLVLAAWGLGSFTGSWLATLLGSGRGMAHGYSAGGLLIAASLSTLIVLPHPAWFWIGTLTTMPIATHLGAKVARGRRADRRPLTAR